VADVARFEERSSGFRRQLEGSEQLAAERDTLASQIETANATLDEWRYLQRACGPDGIQALELDAMGPGIASVANGLLDAAYGSRFRVEFRTTRIGSRGSQKRHIEDFTIWIRDAETGSEKPLEVLSGGETVWVRRAIYDAFGIVRDRRTGLRWLTVIMDEADGALDPAARLRYWQMVQRAHELAGRHQTLVVTQSEDALSTIPQQIRIEDLVVREEDA
jgi:exonuclease SbcC